MLAVLRARIPSPRLASFLLSGLMLAACTAGNQQTPDLVIFGGAIHTGVDGAAPAEAVSVKGDRILAVGAAEALLKSASSTTRLVDLKGAHLYPGFTDAHAHLRGIGERELTLDLDEVQSIAQLQEIVRAEASRLPAGATVIGRGWIETHWPERRFPTRGDLDAVAADRPVIFTRADGHALVANTAALEAAGMMAPNPAQPEGGRIELGPEGLPTGMLIDNAMAPLFALAGAQPPEAVEAAYIMGAKREAALGWTQLHNMSVAAVDVALINRLSDAGQLPLRIYNAVDGEDPKAFEVMGRSDAALVTTRAIKLYMDGALGSRGALLSAPYADDPENRGLQRAPETETLALLARAYEAGAQVCFHAIGDAGNSRVLDWMEKTAAAADPKFGPLRQQRWRVEHAQIISPAEISRFAALGVIPSMQPSHAIGDLYFAPARLGDARLDGAYAWRSLIDAGAIIAGGSDAPVEQGDPRIEFYAAVARKDLKGASGPDWRPGEQVTRVEALKMFTLWPAIAAFQEADLGTIEPGKLADFTGFSGDLLTVPEAEILTLEPVLTVVGGAVVWPANADT